MSKAISDAAREVVAQWLLRPHAIIASDLRRAIEAMARAIDAHDGARRLEEAYTGRKLDHEAWKTFLTNGQDPPGVE